MADFQQQALTLATQQKSPAWLAALRSQAANDWQNIQWPTRKTEHWKYTSLASLQKNTLGLVNASSTKSANDWKNSVELIDVNAIRLVFVNGIFDAESSSALPENIQRFSHANTQQQKIIAAHGEVMRQFGYVDENYKPIIE